MGSPILPTLEATVAMVPQCADTSKVSNISFGCMDHSRSSSYCAHTFPEGTVGHGSCIDGSYTCYTFNGGIIGSSSCSQYAACGQYSFLNNTGIIGDNSCNGPWTCNFITASRNTGDNSCNGYRACANVTCEYCQGSGIFSSVDRSFSMSQLLLY